jgi:hypothetical protein
VLDAPKIYNALQIRDTSYVNFPTNYCTLSTEQKSFVDAIIEACEIKADTFIDEYNEDLRDSYDHNYEYED